jgi:Bacterial TSP3 repeat
MQAFLQQYLQDFAFSRILHSTRILHSKLADTDADGLSDSEERKFGTNPRLADTDGDGLNDLVEVRDHKTNPLLADTDGDGLNDNVEISGGVNASNPRLTDSDGDGFSDMVEIAMGTSPTVPQLTTGPISAQQEILFGSSPSTEGDFNLPANSAQLSLYCPLRPFIP